jgi:hypothetical protein
VNAVYKENDTIMTGFLPKCSLSGPQRIGPTTYPIRKIDIGRTSCRWFVTLKYVEISPIPPLGKDDASVLLMTDMMQPRMTMDFHFCRKAKFGVV